MNIENIHDALNFLDDDLIEAVDKLRNDAKEQKEWTNKRKVTWVRWLSVAACLCIVASIYITDGFSLMSFKGASSDSVQMKDESDSTSAENESKEVAGENSTAEVEVETDKDQITDKSTVEMPSVLIEIVSWQENGFVGTVAGIVDTNIYAVGTEVVVKFSETVFIGEAIDNEMQYREGIPNSTDFPEGSVVSVQFYESETITDDEHTNSHIVILYVGEIHPENIH